MRKNPKKILTFFILVIANLLSCAFYYSEASALIKKADMVLVVKSKRVMMLLKEGEILKTYRIALGKNPNGHKTREGDKRTPEGRYTLTEKNSNSKYYLSMRLSYPNDKDIMNSKKLGVSPGGAIAIHGLPKDLEDLDTLHRYMDWTEGCIAVTNSEMREIWELVSVGTPIEIRP